MRSLLLLSLAAGLRAEEEAAYVELNKESFDDFVRSKDISLVKFYAPWCGFCNKMKPAFEGAAKTLLPDNIHLAKVNCPDERELCERFDVNSYPTLKVFRASEAQNAGKNYQGSAYKGKREQPDIESYMRRQAMPPVSHLETVDAVTEFAGKDKVVAIVYHSGEDTDLFKHFKSVAESNREMFIFGAVKDAEVHKAKGVDAPRVVVYRSFEEPAHYSVDDHGEVNPENLRAFLTSSSIPLMDDISPENYNDYVESGKPLAFLFIADDEQRNKVGPEVREVAKKFRDKINFVFIDTVKYGSHANNLNLKEGNWPAFAVVELGKNQKWPFSQDKEITQAAIQEHVEGIVNGTLEPSIKSQPIPESNDEPNKTIVGKTYKEIALDKEKDVLIKFYAPWCAHCKALVEPWKEVAKKVVDNGAKSVVVAEFDATENDLPPETPFQIEGFPTIKLIKAGDNEAVDYRGDRSVESILDFLRENAMNSAEVPSGKPEPAQSADGSAEGAGAGADTAEPVREEL